MKLSGLVQETTEEDNTTLKGNENPQVPVSSLQKGFNSWLKSQGITTSVPMREYMRTKRLEMHPGNFWVWKGYKLGNSLQGKLLLENFDCSAHLA